MTENNANNAKPTEKKGLLNEPLGIWHLIGGLAVMVVIYGGEHLTNAILLGMDESPGERTTQPSRNNQGSVHPSSSNIVETGRDYIFAGGYVSSTRDELRNLDNLIGNTDALMNRVYNSPYITPIPNPVPTPVTVVRREGGVSSPMHVLIQLSDGRQVWTMPEFLEPVRQ